MNPNQENRLTWERRLGNIESSMPNILKELILESREKLDAVLKHLNYRNVLVCREIQQIGDAVESDFKDLRTVTKTTAAILFRKIEGQSHKGVAYFCRALVGEKIGNRPDLARYIDPEILTQDLDEALFTPPRTPDHSGDRNRRGSHSLTPLDLTGLTLGDDPCPAEWFSPSPNSDFELLMKDEQGAARKTRLTKSLSINDLKLFAAQNEEHIYRTSVKKPRGLMLIIENDFNKFKIDPEDKSPGPDSARLKAIFSTENSALQLNYRVFVKNQLSAKEMRLTVEDFATNPDHELHQYDSCIVAIITHGKYESLLGIHGEEVRVDELVRHFDGNKCIGLRGKPKIFILEACAGEKEDKGYHLDNESELKKMSRFRRISDEEGEVATPEADKAQFDFKTASQLPPGLPLRVGKYPIGADILLIHSSSPGFRSYRKDKEGAYFLQIFCWMVRDHYKHEHILEILSRTNWMVTHGVEAKRKGKHYQEFGLKQTPHFDSSLTKLFFLSPPYGS